MMFNIGQYVVYGASGVCRIVGFEMKKFGTAQNEYCKLEPLEGGSSVYYIPKDSLDLKVRALYTPEQIQALILKIPSIEPIVIDDFRKRKLVLSAAMRSSDPETLIAMIKRLYNELNDRISLGKKINLTDDRLMKDAQNLINQEFSVSLGIDKSEVESYICEKLK